MELDRFKVLLSVKHCYKTRTDPTGRPKTWLIWWLDRSRFAKKPAGATTRQNPDRPGGSTHDPATQANPDETRCFFFKCGFSPIPLFFHIFLVGY
jgi:hypothetical protein